MPFHSKYKIILGAILLLTLALGAVVLRPKPAQAPLPVPTQPDVPNVTENTGWKKVVNAQGVTFEYPEQLSTKYISAQEWPPQISVTEGTFTCTDAGEESARAGKTEKRIVNGRTYCVTKVTEGAAGSIYGQYSYITAAGNNKLVNLIFTLRFVQCANYEEPQKSECVRERGTFDIDNVIDRIVGTI